MCFRGLLISWPDFQNTILYLEQTELDLDAQVKCVPLKQQLAMREAGKVSMEATEC